MYLNKFRDKFKAITTEKWEQYIGYFTRIEVPAKTVLLAEGTIAQKMFFIEKGCIRVWFNNAGKDVTFQFFFENNMVSSLESFRKKTPSMVTVETLEPSVIWYITKPNLDTVLEEIKEIPTLRDTFINTIFQRTFDYMQHFFSSIKDTPQQRYLNLIEQKPQIIQRVPQHYIASYLGITTVHLSRIKNSILKSK